MKRTSSIRTESQGGSKVGNELWFENVSLPENMSPFGALSLSRGAGGSHETTMHCGGVFSPKKTRVPKALLIHRLPFLAPPLRIPFA